MNRGKPPLFSHAKTRRREKKSLFITFGCPLSQVSLFHHEEDEEHEESKTDKKPNTNCLSSSLFTIHQAVHNVEAAVQFVDFFAEPCVFLAFLFDDLGRGLLEEIAV